MGQSAPSLHRVYRLSDTVWTMSYSLVDMHCYGSIARWSSSTTTDMTYESTNTIVNFKSLYGSHNHDRLFVH